MRSGLLALSQGVTRLCRFGAATGLVLMLVLIAIQVVARYLFSEPPGLDRGGCALCHGLVRTAGQRGRVQGRQRPGHVAARVT